MGASDGTDNYTTAWALDTGASAAWTASAGSPLSDTGIFFGIWTTPNAPNTTVRITAVSGGQTVIKDVVIVSGEAFPYRPSLLVEGTLDDVTLIHRMENGLRRGRLKIRAKASYDLTFKNRNLTEYNVADALFQSIGKLTPFLMADPITDEYKAWYFDSAVTRRYGGRGCSIDYSFRVLEA